MIFADLDLGSGGGDLGSGTAVLLSCNPKSVRSERDIVLFEDGALK